jgi:aspartate oxidase
METAAIARAPDLASHVPSINPRKVPFIYEHCLKVGIDFSREPVPVVPAVLLWQRARK